MKQSIKESFDQIHASEQLINDTKRLIHESDKKDVHRHRRISHNKLVTGVLAAAASIAIIFTSVHFINKDKDSTIKFGENQVNLEKQEDSSENVIKVVKSEADWIDYIENIQLDNNVQTTLDDDYTLYATNVTRDNKEYTIQIQIKDGTLEQVDHTLLLTGKFYCVITMENKILSQSLLDELTSTQFTRNIGQYEIDLVADNKEITFSLEAVQENGKVQMYQYSLGSDWTVVKEN